MEGVKVGKRGMPKRTQKGRRRAEELQRGVAGGVVKGSKGGKRGLEGVREREGRYGGGAKKG
jgi:hypothetical protein